MDRESIEHDTCLYRLSNFHARVADQGGGRGIPFVCIAAWKKQQRRRPAKEIVFRRPPRLVDCQLDGTISKKEATPAGTTSFYH